MTIPEIPEELIKKAARAIAGQHCGCDGDNLRCWTPYCEDAEAALSAVYSDIRRQVRAEAFEEAAQAIEESCVHSGESVCAANMRACDIVRSLAGKETP